MTGITRIFSSASVHLRSFAKNCSINRLSVRQSTSVHRCITKPEIISTARKQIDVNVDGKEINRFHAAWLRYNCRCEQCLQSSSGSKTIKPWVMKPSYTIEKACIEGDSLFVRFGEDRHDGKFPLQFLRDNSYSEDAINENLKAEKLDNSSNTESLGRLPVLEYEEVANTKEGQLRWMRHLNEEGLCLMKNVPQQNGQAKKVAELICPVQSNIYGDISDVKASPSPINIAYSTGELGLHMDLAYYESPPGLQLLHCMKVDDVVEGGQSFFVDSFHAVNELRNRYPTHFNTLTRLGATFQKIHYDRDRPVHMVYKRPHISVDPNQNIVSVTWAPSFEGSPRFDQTEMEAYYEAYNTFAKLLENSPTKIEFRLNTGDLISFNNRRILHARRAFELNGGTRHLQVCYVNIDEFKSQLKVLSRELNDYKDVKQVGNNCWM